MENIQKKIIILDLDNTLTESRSPVSEETANILCRLMDVYKVAVISGASFDQFNKQLIDWLTCKEKFKNLYIMPTTGAALYCFTEGGWKQEYTISFPERKKRAITKELAHILDITEEKLSNFIEDRGAQITYSGLGADAPIEQKKMYDPDRAVRSALIKKIKPKLPGISMAIGGRTSIDFTEAGINKAYGITKMLQKIGLKADDVMFIGDALMPGGNDEAVKSLGISTMLTTGPMETNKLLNRLLGLGQ